MDKMTTYQEISEGLAKPHYIPACQCKWCKLAREARGEDGKTKKTN